ncbi:MAG: hypothetical protein FJW63_07910 [Actinobacteria bacterium]|nr:hypothetical protein [Actinomycetota bacterium]
MKKKIYLPNDECFRFSSYLICFYGKGFVTWWKVRGCKDFMKWAKENGYEDYKEEKDGISI